MRLFAEIEDDLQPSSNSSKSSNQHLQFCEKTKTKTAMLDFTNFVNKFLLDVIRREEFIPQYKPFSHLSYEGHHEGSLFIRDNQQKLIADIIFKDDLLYCNSPDSASDFEHEIWYGGGSEDSGGIFLCIFQWLVDMNSNNTLWY
jgi:hypothetical protein